MTASVQVNELVKDYGKKRALNKLSFSVEPGSIYGLIGPNGAGKTTTLSIIAGLRNATSGSVSVFGIEVQPDGHRLASRIGFCSPQYSFFDYLTGREILLACGLVHGLDGREAERRTRDLLELLDLKPAAEHYVYQYSQGMRQKLGLGCALIHSPGLLLLDEPFEGLDATTVFRMIHTLKQIAGRGKTIVLSSHDLARVEAVCNRIGILHEGVLKHETEPVRRESGGQAAEPGARPSEQSLETLLWQVVGTPDVIELSWI